MSSRRRRLRILMVLVTTLGTSLAVAGSAPAAAQEPVPRRAGFTWSTPPRFGVDTDGDGRIEIENTTEYAHNRPPGSCDGSCSPPRFQIDLRATPEDADLDGVASVVSYQWHVGHPGSRVTYVRTGPELTLYLPEGRHDVDLRVRVHGRFGDVTLRSRGTIDVDDIVVAAIGDSYPSGEGSPEAPRRGGDALWADATDPGIEASHALAHRSTVGWAARVALALEVVDPHSSVTFVHLAASGARIDRGVLQDRAQPALPAQLDELSAIVGERRIDLLLVQAGGNDIGFPHVIRQLVDADPVADPVCYDQMLQNVWASARDGKWDRDVRLGYDAPFGIACRPTGGARSGLPGLDGLPAALDRLADGLRAMEVGRVALVEYPDPTGGDSSGATCREIVGDTTPPFGFHEVDEREQLLGKERVLAPLNEALRAAAEGHGWSFVGGVAAVFAEGHGYCAPWPDYGYSLDFLQTPALFRNRLGHPQGWYRPPGLHGGSLVLNGPGVSWYRTASQSAALQGPAPRFLTSGTMHPNELGHMAIARLVLGTTAAGE